MRTSVRDADPAARRAKADELLAEARRESRGGSATRAWELTTEAAERLFLSERTVEQHVRSILRKLDAPKRSAVASWVSRRQ